MAGTTARRGAGSWTGFLVFTFVICGLAGIFATYAAQLPFQRALARDAVLDAVLAAGTAPGPAELPQLRMELGDAAEALATGPGDLTVRVAQARTALHRAALAEGADIRTRLLVVVGVVTAGCALFGAMLLSVVARSTSSG